MYMKQQLKSKFIKDETLKLFNDGDTFFLVALHQVTGKEITIGTSPDRSVINRKIKRFYEVQDILNGDEAIGIRGHK